MAEKELEVVVIDGKAALVEKVEVAKPVVKEASKSKGKK
jgi:hypothetical protein